MLCFRKLDSMKMPFQLPLHFLCCHSLELSGRNLLPLSIMRLLVQVNPVPAPPSLRPLCAPLSNQLLRLVLRPMQLPSLCALSHCVASSC